MEREVKMGVLRKEWMAKGRGLYRLRDWGWPFSGKIGTAVLFGSAWERKSAVFGGGMP